MFIFIYWLLSFTLPTWQYLQSISSTKLKMDPETHPVYTRSLDFLLPVFRQCIALL